MGVRTETDCRKMHFFCIFLQFYLHMSEKSSIFVADLVIVPVATKSFQQVMNKETICKVQIGETIFKTNVLLDEEGSIHGYRVMKGRNLAKGGSYFAAEGSAVMFMLRAAFTDVAQMPIEFSL